MTFISDDFTTILTFDLVTNQRRVITFKLFSKYINYN